MTDQFGYDVTLSNAAALEPWNKTIIAFLAHGAHTPVHLTATLNAAPDFAMAQASRGLFNLLLGRKELVSVAQDALSIAEKSSLETPVTAREAAYIKGLRLWCEGWPSRAADLMDAALKEWPEDALLLKLVHALRFVLGQGVEMRRSIEAVFDAYSEQHVALGYIKGCYAFSLEETGDYKLAETHGRQAVELRPDDAWGLHAVAHVYDMCGESDTGIRWLDTQPQSWSHCNNFGFHVWWHLALMHLDKGNVDRVLELYDDKIRKERSDDYRDISNAASMLMRLELEGINVGGRWEELANLSSNRIDDGCNVFADLHYMMSLLQGNRWREAESMVARMRETASALSGDISLITNNSGVAAAEGLSEFRKGNYFSALKHLQQARPNLNEIGGSHAQRDVFERLTIEAALRAGMPEDAQRMITERTTLRSAPDAFAKVRAQQVEKMTAAATVMQNEALRANLG
ncbi:tetratricopeptide repeat protein [Pseudovibrio sp. SPO723]|nr:tetratricopeptide repeat protein [Pseudovibrio sp. SPO723]MDX5592243.1 tetratricopeptide repeat protein [Pseudovibrio sp. SPO723]